MSIKQKKKMITLQYPKQGFCMNVQLTVKISSSYNCRVREMKTTTDFLSVMREEGYAWKSNPRLPG